MMQVTRKEFRLAVKWNPRDRDTYADCTPRFTNGDLRYILDVFNKDVLSELQQRGYDLKTLRFHVDKTPAAIAEHQRIKSASREADRQESLNNSSQTD